MNTNTSSYSNGLHKILNWYASTASILYSANVYLAMLGSYQANAFNPNQLFLKKTFGGGTRDRAAPAYSNLTESHGDDMEIFIKGCNTTMFASLKPI